MNQTKTTRRVHADLIIAWAEGAQIQFYDENLKQWANTSSPNWEPTTEYRLAPVICLCNSIVIPTPEKEKLPLQTKYFFPCFSHLHSVTSLVWSNNKTDLLLLNAGMIHLTHEAAKAHAEAILKLEYRYAK